MAPSISPNTPGGPNNPGLRLYKFETNTGQVGGNTERHVSSIISVCMCDGPLFMRRDVSIERAGNILDPEDPSSPLFCRIQVLDYTQYYLNLPDANLIGTANWLVEYSLLEYYELQEITAITLHDLVDRFTQFNDYAFVRYVKRSTDKFFYPPTRVRGAIVSWTGTIDHRFVGIDYLPVTLARALVLEKMIRYFDALLSLWYLSLRGT